MIKQSFKMMVAVAFLASAAANAIVTAKTVESLASTKAGRVFAEKLGVKLEGAFDQVSAAKSLDLALAKISATERVSLEQLFKTLSSDGMFRNENAALGVISSNKFAANVLKSSTAASGARAAQAQSTFSPVANNMCGNTSGLTAKAQTEFLLVKDCEGVGVKENQVVSSLVEEASKDGNANNDAQQIAASLAARHGKAGDLKAGLQMVRELCEKCYVCAANFVNQIAAAGAIGAQAAR